jgi:3-hydroxyacyl-CoA dehydrogenase/3-hydroxy-2-methylbutyryl-CoA dehydrogenase
VKVQDSVALVTGGVSGLGFGAASRIVGKGGSVVLLDVNEALGESAAAELGERARFIACDVRDPEAVAESVRRAAEEWGRIDVLVNAAGVAPAQRLISRDGDLFDLDLFRLAIEVNLIGMFDVIRNVVAVMARTEPGAGGERGVGSGGERGLHRRIRRSDRPDRVLGFQSGDRRDDPPLGP